MNTTKYEIELPTLPHGFEFAGIAEIKEGDLMLRHNDSTGESAWVDSLGQWGGFGLIARRRETMAGWANKQRLFQALAEMRSGSTNEIIASGCTLGPWWNVLAISGGSIILNLGVPPCDGKLRLEAGKWVDAT